MDLEWGKENEGGGGGILGSGGGFLFNPVADLTDVALEDGCRLFYVASGEENHRSHSGDCQYEIRQCHLR